MSDVLPEQFFRGSISRLNRPRLPEVGTAAVDHYLRVLGFKLDWQGPRSLASVSSISSYAKPTKDIQVHGFALDWKGLTVSSSSTGQAREDPAPKNELSLGLRNAGCR